MLASETRSQLYSDHARVVVEMANAYHVFSRSVFFNPDMTNQYKANMTKYLIYFTSVVTNIDVYLQED